MGSGVSNLGNRRRRSAEETSQDASDDISAEITEEIEIRLYVHDDHDDGPKMMDDMNDLDLPDLPLDDFEIPEEVDESVESTHGGSLEVALLGVGQGGSRIAEAFHTLGYKKCIVVNTAKHDLHHIDVPDRQKIHMRTDRDGAGKDMDNGAAAARQYAQEIYDRMGRIFGKVDRILVCAGAGGGTGGGGCVELVTIAKKYLTYIGVENVDRKIGCVAALPQSGECTSPNVAQNAVRLVSELCDMADAGKISPLIIMDNDKIRRLYPQLTVKSFWPTVNSTIAGLYHTMNLIPSHSSAYSTFDPADYDGILSMGGCMILGCTNVKDYTVDSAISKALKSNLEKTLLAGGFDLTTAKGVGVVVVGGSDAFENTPGLMESIEQGFDTIGNLTGNSMLHRGIYEMGPASKLRVYTMICGLDRPQKRIDELSKFQR